ENVPASVKRGNDMTSARQLRPVEWTGLNCCGAPTAEDQAPRKSRPHAPQGRLVPERRGSRHPDDCRDAAYSCTARRSTKKPPLWQEATGLSLARCSRRAREASS